MSGVELSDLQDLSSQYAGWDQSDRQAYSFGKHLAHYAALATREAKPLLARRFWDKLRTSLAHLRSLEMEEYDERAKEMQKGAQAGSKLGSAGHRVDRDKAGRKPKKRASAKKRSKSSTLYANTDTFAVFQEGVRLPFTTHKTRKAAEASATKFRTQDRRLGHKRTWVVRSIRSEAMTFRQTKDLRRLSAETLWKMEKSRSATIRSAAKKELSRRRRGR